MRDSTAPDWMLALIARAAPTIARLHGPALLPAGPEMLGCGSFGCVFETLDPMWVCKVSIDGSEAFFARAQQRLGRAPPGVCEYLEPLRVRSAAGPIWIMWRRAVTMPTFDVWMSKNCRPPRDIEDKWFEMELEGEKQWQRSMRLQKQWRLHRGCDAKAAIEEIQQCGLAIAFTFETYVQEIGQPADFANDLRNRRRLAEQQFEPKPGMAGSWSYAPQYPDDPMLRAALRLLGLRWHLSRMKAHKLIGPLARAMQAYLDAGLVVSDAQPDNVALVDGVWSVFDAGLSVPIHPRWDELWMDEDVRTRRWGAEGRMQVWAKLEGRRYV